MIAYLGMDFGTSGARACLLDNSLMVIAEARTNYASDTREGFSHYQNAGDWWSALIELTHDLPLDKIEQLYLCIDGTSGTVLACDHHLTPLSPALMYDHSVPIDIEGINPQSGLARCIYLHQHYRQWVVNQTQWIYMRLANKYLPSDVNNALKMGFDPISSSWHSSMQQHQLSFIKDIPVSAGLFYGQAAPSACNELALPLNTTLISGTTDSIAAFMATGAAQVGDAVTSLGSTLAIKMIVDKPCNDDARGIYTHQLNNTCLIGGASNTGGGVLKQYFTEQEIQTLSKKIAPHQHTGLHFYPLLKTGERFPANDPNKLPVLEPRPEDDVLFFQGILEGIAAIEQQGYEALKELTGVYPKRIFTCGGGSKNTLWSTMRQQMLKCDLINPLHTEAAYGAAQLAYKSQYD